MEFGEIDDSQDKVRISTKAGASYNVVDYLKPKVLLSVCFRGGLNIDKQINNDREQWRDNMVNVSKNIEDLIVHEIPVQVHRDTEIVSGSGLVNCPQKSEELLKQFPGATAIKLDCQDHKSSKTSSNPNMLSSVHDLKYAPTGTSRPTVQVK